MNEEDLLAVMVNEDGVQIKVMVVPPKATGGELAVASRTLSSQVFIVALNSEALLRYTVELMDQCGSSQEVLDAIMQICIDAVAECPEEISLEDL